MAAKLTVAQRQQFGLLAWKLSLQGLSAPAIAEEIAKKYEKPVSEKTVDRLLAEFSEKNEKQLEIRMKRARAEFVAEQREFMADAVKRMRSRGATASQIAAFQRNAMAASKNIGEALGIFVQNVDLSLEHETFTRVYVGVDYEAI